MDVIGSPPLRRMSPSEIRRRQGLCTNVTHHIAIWKAVDGLWELCQDP